jgi:hypothetical protein
VLLGCRGGAPPHCPSSYIYNCLKMGKKNNSFLRNAKVLTPQYNDVELKWVSKSGFHLMKFKKFGFQLMKLIRKKHMKIG